MGLLFRLDIALVEGEWLTRKRGTTLRQFKQGCAGDLNPIAGITEKFRSGILSVASYYIMIDPFDIFSGGPYS